MILLHPETENVYNSILVSPPHALMITGNEGSGKYHLANVLAKQLLSADPDTHPYFTSIHPKNNSITIDQIRELQRFARLRTTGNGNIRRIAVITEAHTLTIEAQNALLKLLEEPPKDTVIILTATQGNSLKPTIYSRTQRMRVRPITKSQALKYAGEIGQGEQAQRAFSLSGGDAGLYVSLLQESDSHPLSAAINSAKNLLTNTPFERLKQIDELTKDKAGISLLLSALKRISTAALRQSILSKDKKLTERWKRTLGEIYMSEIRFAANANSKLLLTDLFLNI